jgi:hypothetical protein
VASCLNQPKVGERKEAPPSAIAVTLWAVVFVISPRKAEEMWASPPGTQQCLGHFGSHYCGGCWHLVGASRSATDVGQPPADRVEQKAGVRLRSPGLYVHFTLHSYSLTRSPEIKGGVLSSTRLALFQSGLAIVGPCTPINM